MRTVVRRVLLMSALMSPGALYALGLGEIKLNSALNQPFDAEIELVSATQEDLGALRAALAPSDTFTRYGLDRPAYLSEFSFQVTRGSGGRDVLRVTSPRPVTEPFVTLLVEANWPRGHLLREYTVLLDPPVFTPGPAASETVAAPRVSSGGATSARATTPVTTAVASPAPVPSAAASPVSAPAAAPSIEPGDSYTVRPNDTLYQIASRANPGSRSDVNRAMVSIYQNNAQAFDGNINVLRSGSTLRIPDASQIQAISAAAASAEVARQYEAWRSGSSAAQATGPADAGRLRLVTPEQGTADPSTSVASTPATSATATPGGAGSAPAPAGDIEARVKQLEAELTEARRLLEVRNAELATLQGGAPATPAEGATTAAGEAKAEAASTAAAPEAKPAKKPTPPREPAATEPEGPSLLERLGEYWWVLAGLLAAALGFTLFQRTRRARGAVEDNLEEALAASDLRSSPKYSPRSREGDILVEEKRAVEPVRTVPGAVGSGAATADAARRTATVEDTLSGDVPGSTESGDALAEADFHMAYGLYDQAADLVQLALKREPQRRDLKLKLLEVFFVWGNRDRFLDIARELNVSRGAAPAGEWDKVLIMGKQLAPDEPLFAAAASASSDSLDMELHGATATLDIDISGMPHTATDLMFEADATATATGLDFVLDDGVRPAGGTQMEPTVESPRVRGTAASMIDTQELTVDNLGLEVDALRELEALSGDDTFESRRGPVDDTVQAPARKGGSDLLDETQDLLSSTALLDVTALMESEGGVVDLTDATGEIASLDEEISVTGIRKRIDFDLGGEPPTMSEVGTKLDLARAYMDMGDPEGARSILDEVLHEGNATQRQEAERLISSLP